MGGAKNCPETPRQKMIGMMYLVLTAMLALNVSANILEGFQKIIDSMDASIVSTSERTSNIMTAFTESANKEDGAKYRDWLKIAKAVGKESDELYNYLENYKNEMVGTDGWKTNEDGTVELANPGELNKASEYMQTQNHGEALRKKLDAFRKYMTSADSPCVRRKMSDKKFKMEWESKVKMYNTIFSTADTKGPDGEKLTWEESMFKEQPLAAAVAMIAKYQNDIRVTENDMINFLFQQGGIGDYSFNKVEAVIIGDEGYYPAGTSHQVRICTAAMDSTHVPDVYVNGSLVPGGMYTVGGGAGEHTYSGYIQVNDHEQIPFTGHYTVFAPSTGSAAIANEDLDIVYQGWPHKFNISAPGVQSSKLHATCSGGSISGSNGNYTVTATAAAGGTLTISVTGEVDGKTSSFGSKTYRIKPKPPVMVKVLGPSGGKVTKLPRNAVGQCHLTASYVGDLLKSDFTVTRFDWECSGGAGGSASSLSDGSIVSALKSARKGDALILSNFKVSGGANVANSNVAIVLQ